MLYHRIARENSDPWSLCVTPEHFAEHLEVLQKFRRIPLTAVDSSRFALPGSPDVVITFDDGYSDNLTAAAPLLRRYDTPATFFIATGYIGAASGYWWDELEHIVFNSPHSAGMFNTIVDGHSLSWSFAGDEPRDESFRFLYHQLRPLAETSRRHLLDQLHKFARPIPSASGARRPMSLHELQNIAAEPLFEIGAHTVNHPLLAARPLHEQRAEIHESKAYLESRLNRPIGSFSYPYGGKSHYSPVTVDVVHECGFLRACTTEAHPVRRGDGPLQIARLNVTDINGDKFLQFLRL